MSKKRNRFLASVRRIGTGLLVAGVLAVSSATGFLLTAFCEAPQQCIASAVMFAIPAYVDNGGKTGNLSGSTAETPALSLNEPSMAHEILVMVQATGIYLIFIAAVILVVLESVELYYLRKLLKRRRFLWAR